MKKNNVILILSVVALILSIIGIGLNLNHKFKQNNLTFINQKELNNIQKDSTSDSQVINETQEINSSDNKQVEKQNVEQPKTTFDSDTSQETKNTEKSSQIEVKESKKTNKEEQLNTYIDEVEIDLDKENADNKLKTTFVTLIDFLFYDGTIKGVTFSELSDTAKLKVLKIALAVDQKIDTYFPDYKEKISTTTNRIYTNCKEKIVAKYFEITTKICNKDEETCTSAKNDFQDMKKYYTITWDFIKNLAQKGLSNLKEWYEIYSGK